MKQRLGKLRSLGPRRENISGLVKGRKRLGKIRSLLEVERYLSSTNVKGRKRLGKIRSLRVYNIACSSQGKS